ncbi:MAG: DNA recombination protein RmuC [Oscillospiraceae bacterium]|nr:DNA recombination protein RmuC [Oscillospiraceae bacterium]
MELVTILCVVNILLLAAVIVILLTRSRTDGLDSLKEYLDMGRRGLSEQIGTQNSAVSENVRQNVELMGRNIVSEQKNLRDITLTALDDMSSEMSAMKKDTREEISEIRTIVTEKMQSALNSRLDSLTSGITSSVTELGKSLREEQKNQLELIGRSMEQMRRENSESLEKINGTVSEKLTESLDKRISESFRTVSDQLMSVSKGLGEMQSVAANVTDLKKVLSNVKTRGNFGEVQLEAILADILTPQQYIVQAGVTGDEKRVDFAVKLPGADGEPVYLPIDAKFPAETYAALTDAVNSGDRQAAEERRKKLIATVRDEAKSISQKYISPPATTDFAVMFLPSEGLYCEVVNLGLIDELQRTYRVNIAGPSTMAAMLSSLRMGFQTLKIQQKSAEIQRVLEDAKKEFASFGTTLESAQKKLKQTEEELTKLLGTRTNAINRALSGVTEDRLPLREDQ